MVCASQLILSIFDTTSPEQLIESSQVLQFFFVSLRCLSHLSVEVGLILQLLWSHLELLVWLVDFLEPVSDRVDDRGCMIHSQGLILERLGTVLLNLIVLPLFCVEIELLD